MPMLMQQTVPFIILAAILALGLVLFQYRYRHKEIGKIGILLSSLRFLSWFGLFLLLINPLFKRNKYVLEKSNLWVLVDNSSSMREADVKNTLEVLSQAKALSDRFNVQFYGFGDDLNSNDSLSFDESNTNITKALKSVQAVAGKSPGAIILISDGNQTLGEDYEFYGNSLNRPVYSIAVGDTTRYEDLRISQVIANRYAFLNNKFPLEVYVNYEGNGSVTTTLNIAVDGKSVYRERINFTKSANSKIINTLVDARSVGLKNISASVENLENERNTVNNRRQLAIEVIDEKTNVAIFSEIMHPDLGTIKKSIESNEQRSVSILKPTVNPNTLEEIDLFVLYQPTTSFRPLYKYINQRRGNIFTITGPQTDWNFLNMIQNSFTYKSYYQSEEVTPQINRGFSLFNIDEVSIEDYPPLENDLGEAIINKSHETLITQLIKGMDMGEPMLVLMSSSPEREAVLFGENIWKWRMQSYRNSQSFDNFNDFMGKLLLYLTTNKSKNRFSVDYRPVYEGSSQAKLTAVYFDAAYIFDSNASIILKLKQKETGAPLEIPMLLKDGYYEADLTGLSPGEYTFTAQVENEELKESGHFVILDFDLEQQLLSSDYRKLQRFSASTKGQSYSPSETARLVGDLRNAEQFVPTQKREQNVVPLIDFRYLLGIVVAALSLEWFIRKYNGLT
jgi:hypothetical protein